MIIGIATSGTLLVLSCSVGNEGMSPQLIEIALDPFSHSLLSTNQIIVRYGTLVHYGTLLYMCPPTIPSYRVSQVSLQDLHAL